MEFSRLEGFLRVAFAVHRRLASGLMGYSGWLAASCCNLASKDGKHCQNGHKMVSFLSEFRRDVWQFSRFEGFLKVAFGVHAGAWLVGSWATRASWLPAAATWLLKMENIAKITKLSQNGKFSSEFRRDVWEFSRAGWLLVAAT